MTEAGKERIKKDRNLLSVSVSATMTEAGLCVKGKLGTRYCAPRCG